MLAEQLDHRTMADGQETAGSDEVYRPDSPFLPEPEYAQGDLSEAPLAIDASPEQFSAETPFLTEYSLPGIETESVEASVYRQVMEQIFDSEFAEAIEDLVNELRAVNDNRFVGETAADPFEAERFLETYVDPLRQEIEASIDRMIHESESLGDAVTETQLDHFLEQFEYPAGFSNPVFESFFGKLFKKIKKAAKAGFKAVKKVGKVLSKLSPVHLVLRKMKKLARPLIYRVLKFALNKLPKHFRPMARKLARRFLKRALREVPEAEVLDDVMLLQEGALQADALAADAESATYPTLIINAEFDALLAGYIIDGEDFDLEPAVNDYFNGSQFENAINERDLHGARERFIERIINLPEGEDPEPLVEEFVTAILAAAKLGIKLIGRKRVVKYLSKIVARIIKRFVGKRAARPLSRALVNAGLKLVNLENQDELQQVAGETLAITVQETIEQFLLQTPEDAFDDEAMLEHYVQSAFERAVAANFPTQLIRPDLRDTKRLGAWVLRSSAAKLERYKKYTRPLDISITAQKANVIKSFGNQSLKSFLKEQLGLPIESQAVSATLHLYEAIPGTTPSAISNAERGVAGLGSSRRAAWMQIHPLTRAAAAVLIPEDLGLGRDVTSRFLVSRDRTAVGQRFYFLEIPGARMMQTRSTSNDKPGSVQSDFEQPVRASEINVVLDFAQRRIDVSDYLSEAASAEIASQLRSGKSAAAIVGAVEKSLRSGLSDILSGSASSRLTVRREVHAPEAFIESLVPNLKTMGSALSQVTIKWIVSRLIQQMKTQGNELARSFIAATEDPADGVTITFSLSQMDEVMATLTNSVTAVGGALHDALKKGMPGALTYTVRPGFHMSSAS